MSTSSDVKLIFGKALELAAEDRPAFLDQQCAGNDGLRKEVDGLFEALEKAGQFMAHPAVPQLDAAGLADEIAVGSRIGPYQLLRKLGEGGMGVVYLAEQEQPVKRQVALKIIKAGLGTEQIVTRFQQERQALALMNHPNIAQVIDAGTTDAGEGPLAAARPYVVMEHVDGLPITQFCDQQRLSPKERLELFVSVCLAVQHAHQKGVIHRDLKPSNVLVALLDGRPVPKIIDFGVAKAVGPAMSDWKSVTEVGVLVGTLEYMSPEQADSGNRDIDTRTDIYSLGVILYELLAGSPPFSAQQLRDAGLGEMLRLIQMVEPPAPSNKLTSSEALPSIAAARRLEPRTLVKRMTGELDWIVMKCLEKDRARRYDTADGLASDIQHFLNDEPVLAGPPSASYRLKKFLRRHQGPVIAAALVLGSLVTGIVGTTWGMVRAEHARRAAAERAQGERIAKETAEKRLNQLEKGVEMLAAVFTDLDPRAEEKQGRPLRAILAERLDQVGNQLEGDAVGDPLVVAGLQNRLGGTYLGLSHAAKAVPLIEQALDTRKSKLGPEHPLTLSTMHHLARAYEEVGKRGESIALFEHVREVQERTLGEEHPDTLDTLAKLAWAYHTAGKKDEPMKLLERVRDIRLRTLGADHPLTIDTMRFLAGVYLAIGRKDEAIELLKQVHGALVQRHGSDHPETLAALNNLALTYQGAGKMRLALELLEQTRDRIVPVLGEDHASTLLTLDNLAWTYRAFGRTEEAIELGERIRAKRVLYLGADHPLSIYTFFNLGMSYQAEGKLETALPMFQQAAAALEKLQFLHGSADLIVANLCECLEQLNRFDQAELWRRKWLAAVERRDGSGSAAHIDALYDLGTSLVLQQNDAEAEPVLRQCLSHLESQPGPPWLVLNAQLALGALLLRQQQYEEAERLLLRVYDGLGSEEMVRAQAHFMEPLKARLRETAGHLVTLYDATGRPDQAARFRVP